MKKKTHLMHSCSDTSTNDMVSIFSTGYKKFKINHIKIKF